MKPFQLTNKAKSDLRDIALFTSRRWGREQRNIYLKQLDDSFWLLAENPDIGKACDEIRDGYRKSPQGSHVIFYRQTGSQNIEIIRILHKSMDVNPIFGAVTPPTPESHTVENPSAWPCYNLIIRRHKPGVY